MVGAPATARVGIGWPTLHGEPVKLRPVKAAPFLIICNVPTVCFHAHVSLVLHYTTRNNTKITIYSTSVLAFCVNFWTARRDIKLSGDQSLCLTAVICFNLWCHYSPRVECIRGEYWKYSMGQKNGLQVHVFRTRRGACHHLSFMCRHYINAFLRRLQNRIRDKEVRRQIYWDRFILHGYSITVNVPVFRYRPNVAEWTISNSTY